MVCYLQGVAPAFGNEKNDSIMGNDTITIKQPTMSQDSIMGKDSTKTDIAKLRQKRLSPKDFFKQMQLEKWAKQTATKLDELRKQRLEEPDSAKKEKIKVIEKSVYSSMSLEKLQVVFHYAVENKLPIVEDLMSEIDKRLDEMLNSKP